MADEEDRQAEEAALSRTMVGGEASSTPPRDLATPTQDELPQLISTLAPGVSASGIQAAASALRGIPIPVDNGEAKSPEIDDVSDSELNEDDLGNLAVRPVDKADEQGRLSNVSR